MTIILFIIVLWYGGLFFQTFFLHRYAAHQTYTMSKTTERITFILTWLFPKTSKDVVSWSNNEVLIDIAKIYYIYKKYNVF
jgi:fatty-acid desaturase